MPKSKRHLKRRKSIEWWRKHPERLEPMVLSSWFDWLLRRNGGSDDKAYANYHQPCPRTTSMPNESVAHNAIINYIRGLGGWVIKVHGGPYQQRGVPDLLVCFKGLFFSFEVKMPNRPLTPLQQKRATEIQNAGGQAHRVESVDDVAKILFPGD